MKTILILVLTSLFALALPSRSLQAGETDATAVGVTEPQEQIDLTFPESGVIRAIPVEEGQRVQAGAVLAQLDCRVLESQLAIARMRAESPAGVQSATAKLDMRRQRLTELEKLAASNNANPDELARARAEFEVAQADLLIAQEAVIEHQYTASQIEAQIEQRTLRAPFDGIVSRITHDEAASVSMNDGPIVSLVKLDQLELVMHIDHRRVDGLATGQTVKVEALDRPVSGSGTIEFISPVTDPSSGTIRLRIALPNEKGEHLSGVKYRVYLPDPATTALVTDTNTSPSTSPAK